MDTPLRVVVADDDRDTREFLQEALTRLGWNVIATASSGKELIETCRCAQPDLIVTDIKMAGMDGIEAAMAVNREAGPVPVVLVSAHHDQELLARLDSIPILGYLVKPVMEASLKAAVAVAVVRFRHLMALKQEATDLRQALDDRKVVERAKGVLMRRLGLDEDEAFRRLRTTASSKNMKLVEVSQQINAAESVFTELDTR